MRVLLRREVIFLIIKNSLQGKKKRLKHPFCYCFDQMCALAVLQLRVGGGGGVRGLEMLCVASSLVLSLLVEFKFPNSNALVLTLYFFFF